MIRHVGTAVGLSIVFLWMIVLLVALALPDRARGALGQTTPTLPFPTATAARITFPTSTPERRILTGYWLMSPSGLIYSFPADDGRRYRLWISEFPDSVECQAVAQ